MPDAPLYDTIGRGYAEYRRPDPRIAAAVHAALGDARHVLNVGAGAGSYEPDDRYVTAVEPSAVMAAQRPSSLTPAVLSRAEDLPFVDNVFDAAMAILTIHHWHDLPQGLAEVRRVTSGSIVIVTCDPATTAAWWLPQHYAPELVDPLTAPLPSLATLRDILGEVDCRALPVPARCSDGFLLSFWDRPERVLDAGARAAASAFGHVPAAAQERMSTDLARDLANGSWDARHGRLRALPAYDVGLRLVVAYPT